jgi:acyl-coenzyme A thioesterase PaaI-like protein
MTTLQEFLDARPQDDGSTLMGFPRALHGAFGGAFGGGLAAAVVLVARDAAPGRVPAGLDCRFLRPLPAGDARITTEVMRAGRSLTCVAVELRDERDRVATFATVSLVEPTALHPLEVAGTPAPPTTEWRGWTVPEGIDIPIVETLAPRLASIGPAIATSVRIPWDDPKGEHTAEAACMAADFCVGPPVAAACAGTWLPHPNPDISLRFAPVPTAGPEVTGVGRVVRIVGGLAVVDVDVHADGLPFAAGAATSMVLRSES